MACKSSWPEVSTPDRRARTTARRSNHTLVWLLAHPPGQLRTLSCECARNAAVEIERRPTRSCSLGRPEVVELGDASAGRDLHAPRRSFDQQAASGTALRGGPSVARCRPQELMEHFAVGAQDGVVILGIGEAGDESASRWRRVRARPTARLARWRRRRGAAWSGRIGWPGSR